MRESHKRRWAADPRKWSSEEDSLVTKLPALAQAQLAALPTSAGIGAVPACGGGATSSPSWPLCCLPMKSGRGSPASQRSIEWRSLVRASKVTTLKRARSERVERLFGESGDPWPAVAGCQIWRLRLQQARFENADVILESLEAKVGLEKLALFLGARACPERAFVKPEVGGRGRVKCRLVERCAEREFRARRTPPAHAGSPSAVAATRT